METMQNTISYPVIFFNDNESDDGVDDDDDEDGDKNDSGNGVISSFLVF